MFVKDLQSCEETVAEDNTIIREILHPDKANLKLRYSLAHAVIKTGEASRRHKLRTSEVYYILEGKGIMYIDNEQEKIYPGRTIYIPPHSVQYIRNTGKSDLRFLCIVDPAWHLEDEEIV